MDKNECCAVCHRHKKERLPRFFFLVSRKHPDAGKSGPARSDDKWRWSKYAVPVCQQCRATAADNYREPDRDEGRTDSSAG